MNGYLYLLVHPDKPGCIKIGRTTRSPVQRLAEHNQRGECGRIARETGIPWRLVHYVPVTDVSKAEAFFLEYLAKYGRSELFTLPLDEVMLDLVNSEFLDKHRYQEMKEELKEYDVSTLLESARAKREERRALYEKRRVSAEKMVETKRTNRANSKSGQGIGQLKRATEHNAR